MPAIVTVLLFHAMLTRCEFTGTMHFAFQDTRMSADAVLITTK